MKDEFVDACIKVVMEKKVAILEKVYGLNSFDGVLKSEKMAINVCTWLGLEISEYVDPFFKFVEVTTQKFLCFNPA